MLYKAQLRLIDSPLQVTMWTKRVRAVDFTLGYEVRPVDRRAGLAAGGDRRDAAGRGAHRRATAGSAFGQASGVPAALAAMTEPERGIWLDNPTQREDLTTFVERALRLDEAAVIRLRARADGLVVAWVSTGLDVLAGRVVVGQLKPADLSCGADALAAGLTAMDSSGYVDTGFRMDSAWRGGLPPDTGFEHLDDVPAGVLLDLAQRGPALAKEHCSAHGPPASLLDQDVVQVSSGDARVGVPMRCVFALTAMGFVPESEPSPPTRSCGCVCFRRGCVSTRGSDRCTGDAATPRWCCANPFSASWAHAKLGNRKCPIRRRVGDFVASVVNLIAAGI